MRKIFAGIALMMIILCMCFGCGGAKSLEAQLDTSHSCDRIIAAASSGALVEELAGAWGVSVGFELKIKQTGVVTFSNFQFDEVDNYTDGKLIETEGALDFEDLYIEDPWTKVSGKVLGIECRVFTVGKQSQIMVNFDFVNKASYYGIEKYLDQAEPGRCLKFDYKDRSIVRCEAHQPRG